MLNTEPSNEEHSPDLLSQDGSHTFSSRSSREPLNFEPVNFSLREKIVMQLEGPEPDSRMARIIEDRGGLQWANFYPHALDRVVVGCHQGRYPTHTDVHIGMIDQLTELQGALAPQTLKQLRESKVDGYKDGVNYVVRIEDHAPLLELAGSSQKEVRDPARAELDKLLAKYERAIELAGIACQDTGGEVLLQAEGAPQITLTKMLGRLHQAAYQKDLSGIYISKARQETLAGTFYYCRSNGTRYKTPDQFEAMASMVDDADKFISGMQQMLKWMTTDNQRGSREAQFLVVSPETSELVSRGPVIDGMILQLEDLIETCEEARGDWENSKEIIAELVVDMAKYQRSLNHADFRYHDLSNAIYVQKISDILKRGGEGLSLGPGFSTPQEAVEIGHFRRDSSGKREFIHSSSDSEHERLISWVERNFPEVAEADWLCLCRPRIPLTFEHHPSAFVSSFGDSEDQSFVVLIGRLGEPERRLVIRRNIYAIDGWEVRNTERTNQLLKEHTPEFLTKAVHFFQQNQYYLAGVLREVANAQHSQGADMFEPIQIDPEYTKFGDHEYRPFYDGKRVDLESLMTWSEARIRGALTSIGEIIAQNVIKQVPVLPFSSLIITRETEGTQVPLSIMSLSESETFCHSLEIKSPSKYLATIPTLYGSHIAVWVESFLQGEFCKAPLVTAKRITSLRTELIEHCLDSFESTLKTITTSGQSRFVEAIGEVRNRFTEFVAEHGNLPPELDMRRYLGLSQSLCELKTSSASKLKYWIKEEANNYCKIIRNSLRETGDQVSSPILKESVVDSVYSLVSNHFSDGSRFNKILELLSRDDSESGEAAYSPSERLWLYTIVDVGAWLSEIRQSEKSGPLLQAASTSPNIASFLDRSDVISGLNLPRQTLTRFYEAVSGLRQVGRELEPDHEKRTQLVRDIRSAYAMRGLHRNM